MISGNMIKSFKDSSGSLLWKYLDTEPDSVSKVPFISLVKFNDVLMTNITPVFVITLKGKPLSIFLWLFYFYLSPPPSMETPIGKKKYHNLLRNV